MSTMNFPLMSRLARPSTDGVLPLVEAINRRWAAAWNQFVCRPCRATERHLMWCDAQARGYMRRVPLLELPPVVSVLPSVTRSRALEIKVARMRREAEAVIARCHLADPIIVLTARERREREALLNGEFAERARQLLEEAGA